jgi:hypothetical protein
MLERPGGLYGSRAPFPEVMGAQQSSDKCLLERRLLPLLLLLLLLLLVMVGGDWHQAVSGCEEDLVERFSEHCKG